MSINLYPSSSASNPSQVTPNNESIYALPPYMQVSRGLVSGASLVNIYGYQGALPNSGGATFYPVWENATAYAYPGSAITMYLWSSSGNGYFKRHDSRCYNKYLLKNQWFKYYWDC